ncbi:MAG: C39 family peptidase [Candidatus Kerfeldbacteria bacterium]
MHLSVRKIVVSCTVILAVLAGWFGYTHRVAIKDRLFSHTEDVPAAVNRDDIVTNSNSNTSENANANLNTNTPVAEKPLPEEFNLKVPFTSQAPHANWDTDHDEFCEEAAVLMVGRYWQDRGIADKDEAEDALQQLKTWEVEHLGFYYDTTAAESASILTGMYDISFDLIEDPTVDAIKRAVVSGRPVIVPTAGRELGNPNFRQPGPVYHNLVIKGYTKDGRFITNDPGTRKGADYVYDTAVVMNAMHDWVPKGDRTKAGNGAANGKKVIIIARGVL